LYIDRQADEVAERTIFEVSERYLDGAKEVASMNAGENAVIPVKQGTNLDGTLGLLVSSALLKKHTDRKSFSR